MENKKNLDLISKERFEIKLSELDLNSVISLDHQTSVKEIIHTMQDKKLGSLLITDNESPVGIVTERDLVMKYTGNHEEFLDMPISSIMTTKLVTIGEHESVSQCMRIMGGKRIRHLPVCDENGKVTKMISINDLLKFIIDSFPIAVKSMGTLYEWNVQEIHVQDENFSFSEEEGSISGSLFMMPLRKVVTRDLIKMDVETTIEKVISKMQERKNGMVILTRHETLLKGIITERDILNKVLGKVDLNSAVSARDFMTLKPDTLLEKHILSYGINNMYSGKYRNIILVDEERIPVSYVALVDIIRAISDKISKI